ncbi:unnamed protein product [Lactuca saligna]|uniref:Uncharacterized protein n=1 Tax=Lactuca saligna TaxID=75948 RepID=A0AA35VN71_LACSI|nr:unnamed protein product [Lactuca saligna]
MNDLRISFDKNTTDMIKMIEGLHSSVKAKKEALSKLCSEIKLDNIDMNSTISTKLEKLQNDLAAENKIMDTFDEQTQKVKVLTKKMKNATLNISNLEEEKSLVNGKISEINQHLLRIVETRDSLFIVSVRQNLFEKLQIVFTMLNRLQSVSGSRASAKQGRDEEAIIKNDTDQKDNKASRSGKDKGKGVSEEDNDENPILS